MLYDISKGVQYQDSPKEFEQTQVYQDLDRLQGMIITVATSVEKLQDRLIPLTGLLANLHGQLDSVESRLAGIGNLGVADGT